MLDSLNEKSRTSSRIKDGEVKGRERCKAVGEMEMEGEIGGNKHTLYPLALLEISSTLPWMLSIGLDWVGMFSSAVWATVWSWGMSVIVAGCSFV